jgi:small redox-active disulfide protein 2
MKKIQILGMGCKKCQLLTEHAEAAAKQLGIDYEIEKVTDVDAITEMGVMVTPALAIDGSVVLSGTTSSPEQIKKILQTLQ